ncbi:MAG: carbohydrate deacetylase [Anaerolineae bacterium]
MRPNPVLRKLGFADDDRLVIIHTDDIGMCQASVAAFADLWDFGLISSGAVMVPCPWFLEAAQFARAHPDADLGVHITLTSEWATYRWGPISTVDRASGLFDEEGYFPHRAEQTQASATPEAVSLEIQAQIERALQMGMQPTHADTHMGTVAHPKFIPAYIQMALRFGLPPMIMRFDEEGWLRWGLDPATARFAAQVVAQLEEQGVPLLDHLSGLELDRATTTAERIAYARQVLGDLEPGVTHFIIHPSVDTPELRAITPDWRCRVADYNAFSSEELKSFVAASGLHVIGYRDLQRLMQA